MRRRQHQLVLEAFGVRIGVVASDLQIMEAIQRRSLPPSWEEAAGSTPDVNFRIEAAGRDTYDLYRDDDQLAQSVSLALTLAILDSSMRLVLAVRAVDWVFIHAGVVRSGDVAMLLPGESFSGKSTLVTALVSQGATYMSDEFAVLSPDGLVHPYARDISMRIEGKRPLHTTETAPQVLGNVEAVRPATVGFIVSTRYRPNASWTPARRSRGEGALALLAHAAAARERPAEVLATVRAAAAGAIVLEGERGDAGETARALIELIDKGRGGAPAS